MTLADNIDWVVVIQSGVKMELPKNRPGFKGLLVCKSDVRVVGNDELVLLAGSHVQGVVANEELDIMNVPGVSAIVFVFGNRFEGTPRSLKVIYLNVCPKACFALPKRGAEPMGRMRRTDNQGKAHLVHRD